MAVADGIPGAVPETADAAQAHAAKPTATVKLFYSLGQFVESGYLIVNSFIFFYYTAVLGLPGTMVGAAVAISMCIDAVGDPLIGSWSDGIRSRLGRRLPAMLVGAPLTLLTMGLLFAPPGGLSPFLLFGWLTLMKMGVRFFASVYNIPYFALGGEMSDDYNERSRIVAWRLLAGIVVSVLVTRIAYGGFFAGAGGLQQPERYPVFGWAIGGLIAAGGLISCLGIWRFATRLPQPMTPPPPMLRRLPGELLEVLGNRSFRILFLSMLLFASASGVHSALNNHNYVFVWKLRPEAIQYMLYAVLAGITVGVPLTPILLRWMEKKTAVLVGFSTVIVTWLPVPVARAMGLFAPTGAEAMPWLVGTTLFVGIGSGVIFVALPSMMSDAADEHEHLNGSRREGLFFAGLAFAGKAAGGVGTLVGGVTLDLLHFPREVGRQVNAVLPEELLRGLVLAWGPLCALLSVMGALVFASFSITRAHHEVILADLKRKRAAAR